ncbi:MAG TPA: DNA-deoxyinosine glycosylase [Sphingomicrobium sp.]|nr:DNA-deoxyinosine glycosylase [Sphingomicrobium sp.]
MSVKYGLAAIADTSTRLFILGSLPGERSLGEQRYYAHPTNQFWRLVGLVIGENLQGLDYGDRLALLCKYGIGLWDVVGAARREGSGDHAIHDATHNDIGGLKRDYPLLRAIGFNGGLASREGLRLLSGAPGLTLIPLPSSSAANARMSFEQKAKAWTELRRFLTLPLKES